ncbi:cysteine--tRNA ligase, partial [Candidatus Woesearchaeota archaeon]|nr:cysteine--tRNA ligase [Candidatus Woesearchaeota archaeon]
VDDKTISNAQKEGIPLQEYTKRYEKAFFEDLETLTIDKADIFPRATEHIKEMIALIQKLKKKTFTYESEDSVYYRIAKFKHYGKLSKIKLEEQKEGARVDADEYEKQNAKDFVLWKAKKEQEPSWKTSLGEGRPGWHIECSAMSMKYLGETFDIHAGGIDLIFPHHENEIAQSEAATGKKFVNYWFHNEHLLVEGKKMAKSLGNFFTLRDLLQKGHHSKAIRYLLLSAHYRYPLNFTEEGLHAAASTIQRMQDFVDKLKSWKGAGKGKSITRLIEKAKKDFEKEMDEDVNISNALAVIFDFMKDVNKAMAEHALSSTDAKAAYRLMLDFDTVLGILESEEIKIPQEILTLAEKREQARKARNWQLADQLREQVQEKGYAIEDTTMGYRLKKST